MRKRESPLRRLIVSLALVALVIPVWAVAAGRGDDMPRQRLSVLLLGNSMTRYNALPERLASLLRAARPEVDLHVAALAPDGESLAGHLAGDSFRRLLDERVWDYVVLQERTLVSTWTLDGTVHYDPPGRYLADVGAVVALVRAHGAEPVLYQTWTPSAPDGFAYVDYATVEAARAHGARLAPVGRVWRTLSAQGLSMTASDGVHPTPLASYAAAASIAVALIGGDALGRGVDTEGAAAPRDNIDQHPQALAAVRSAYEEISVGDGGPPPPVARPAYEDRPRPRRSDRPLLRHLTGTWRAREGGTRLSHGTELTLAVDGGRCVATVREYTAMGVLAPPVSVHHCDEERLELTFTSSAVEFHIAAWLERGALSVLTRQGSEKTRMQYRRVRYVRDDDRGPDSEATYFDALRGLYARLERDTHRRGLATALGAHSVRLRAFLGEDRLVRDRQGFPLNEWDLILAGWHYTAVADPEKALAHYAAGAELYPESVDIHLTYGDVLARTQRNAAAAAAYDAALALLDPQKDAARHKAVTAKREALKVP